VAPRTATCVFGGSTASLRRCFDVRDWILEAKRAATRQRRIRETVRRAAAGKRGGMGWLPVCPGADWQAPFSDQPRRLRRNPVRTHPRRVRAGTKTVRLGPCLASRQRMSGCRLRARTSSSSWAPGGLWTGQVHGRGAKSRLEGCCGWSRLSSPAGTGRPNPESLPIRVTRKAAQPGKSAGPLAL
jgi:hypothetical protein